MFLPHPIFLLQCLLTGLMFNKPADPIRYLQSCLAQVEEQSLAQVKWDFFLQATKNKTKLPPIKAETILSRESSRILSGGKMSMSMYCIKHHFLFLLFLLQVLKLLINRVPCHQSLHNPRRRRLACKYLLIAPSSCCSVVRAPPKGCSGRTWLAAGPASFTFRCPPPSAATFLAKARLRRAGKWPMR